ncbi:MAG: helix-turn-helix transcriptional regulator [Promicromonosporaceae bacterium]|nr:helix-turn-helix transcriptional regulator [Promicromonosporaceae bacterium]
MWQAALGGVTLDEGKPASTFEAVRVPADEVGSVLERLISLVETSYETAIPYFPPAAALPGCLANERALLARGVEVRDLVPTTLRASATVRRYARELAGEGGQMRAGHVGSVHRVIADRVISLHSASGADEEHDGDAWVTRVPSQVQSDRMLFDASWQAGVDLSEPMRPVDRISHRGREVLRHIRTGSTNAEIGRTLGVSQSQVERDIRNLKELLQVRHRSELAAAAQRHGI